jgi:hypothetical protein
MNRHLLRALLALYPRAWRGRYGAELASLTGELISAGEITPLSAVFNLAGGAALERGRVLAGSRRAAVATALVAIMAVAGSFCLTGLVRLPGRPASARSVPEPAAAGGPAGPGAYPGSAPSPVPASTLTPAQEQYGLRTPGPVATICALSSCGPLPSPVAVSTTSLPEEHGQ